MSSDDHRASHIELPYGTSSLVNIVIYNAVPASAVRLYLVGANNSPDAGAFAFSLFSLDYEDSDDLQIIYGDDSTTFMPVIDIEMAWASWTVKFPPRFTGTISSVAFQHFIWMNKSVTTLGMRAECSNQTSVAVNFKNKQNVLQNGTPLYWSW